jgi:hypothetical protein
MRTIKELLQLMLDNKHFFQAGLCNWAANLRYYDIINIEEHYIMHQYIRDNRPFLLSSIDAFKHRNKAFYWEFGDIKPRIKWLKKHIAKN